MSDTPSAWILDTLEPHWEASALRNDLLKKSILAWHLLDHHKILCA